MITKKQIHESMEYHRKTSKSYTGDSFECGWQCGFASALGSILDHWDEIYQAHRLESAIEDAENHLRDYLEDDDEYEIAVNSGLPEVIAERFLDNHDCNAAENDQYESIIEDLLKN